MIINIQNENRFLRRRSGDSTAQSRLCMCSIRSGRRADTFSERLICGPQGCTFSLGVEKAKRRYGQTKLLLHTSCIRTCRQCIIHPCVCFSAITCKHSAARTIDHPQLEQLRHVSDSDFQNTNSPQVHTCTHTFSLVSM